MKRRTADERGRAPVETKQDIESLVGKMAQHLLVLERKLDTLISRTSERPLEVRFSNPYQHQRAGTEQPPRPPDQPNRPAGQRPDRNPPPRDRVMHKAVCAECKSACEVPFKPSGDRPVYCKECYAKRRNGGHARAARAQRTENAAPVQKRHAEPAPAAAAAAPARQARKPGGKKKRETRRRR